MEERRAAAKEYLLKISILIGLDKKTAHKDAYRGEPPNMACCHTRF